MLYKNRSSKIVRLGRSGRSFNLSNVATTAGIKFEVNIFIYPFLKNSWGSVSVDGFRAVPNPDTNITIYLLTAKYFNFIFKYLCIFFEYIVTSWKLGAIPETKENEKIIIFAQNETFLNTCFNMENLTELERAAIIFHVFGGCKDRKILFQIAEGENRVKRLNENSLKTICNTWFNSHKIQSGIKYVSTLKQDRETEIINKYITGLETESTNQDEKQKNNLKTNFLDRDEFLQFLNDKANAIQDDKLRNDILKMLSENLRYKDSERDKNNEIQRFYTPITCENCEIYKRCKGCSLSSCPAML